MTEATWRVAQKKKRKKTTEVPGAHISLLELVRQTAVVAGARVHVVRPRHEALARARLRHLHRELPAARGRGLGRSKYQP